MGTFRIEISVAGLDGEKPVTVSPLVDTGATHSMMPTSLLNRLGVATESDSERLRWPTAGRRPTTSARPMFSVGAEVMPCPVIFGREGRYLLGATTLENFDLAVDPVNQKLTPVAELTHLKLLWSNPLRGDVKHIP